MRERVAAQYSGSLLSGLIVREDTSGGSVASCLSCLPTLPLDAYASPPDLASWHL